MSATAPSRHRSLDVVRGLVCVLVAIDHVRVYAAVPAGGPDPAVFFTRWITHFVAPVFCFFAGTGAFFLGRKLGDMRALARFLATRGLLLVVLELTFIRYTWTFNFDYANYVLAGVIWMLGWCMVLLALLVRLSPKTVGITGLVIVLVQQVFFLVGKALPAIAPYWAFLYPSGAAPAFGIKVLYVIVPWIGVMAAGYGFGLIMQRDEPGRRTTLLRIGLGATAAFLVLATVQAMMAGGGAGEAGGEGAGPPLYMKILNQQKYPASQLFLLMTLGPAIAILPWAEKSRNGFTTMMETFGRVPMFYYLLHIPLIHLAAMVVSQIRTGGVIPQLVGNFPLNPPEMPEGYRWSLGLLYLVWAIVVFGLLYPACRWYAARKAAKPGGWMQYI